MQVIKKPRKGAFLLIQFVISLLSILKSLLFIPVLQSWGPQVYQ